MAAVSDSTETYELLDFGRGRKLERFGSYVVDRPAPSVSPDVRPAREALWHRADARYEGAAGGKGRWIVRREPPTDWIVRSGRLTFELKLTPFGHVGLFPEQADNWKWIDQQIRRAGRRVRVLNLFGYTGGSTLAAAAAGAEVVHIDSARNTIRWARRNANRSALGEAPIRWITEDAAKFARREIKRGNRYHAVILDPPSYGHGPKGEVWRLERGLVPLLSRCAALIRDEPLFLLLTCHSAGYDPPLLEQVMRGALARRDWPTIECQPMRLRRADGETLAAGVAVRWTPAGPANRTEHPTTEGE